MKPSSRSAHAIIIRVAAVGLAALLGACGEPQGRGDIAGAALPAEVVQDKQARVAAAASAAPQVPQKAAQRRP